MTRGVLVIALRDFRRYGLRMEVDQVERIPADLATLLTRLGCVRRHRKGITQ
jgi:hypothetical protein